MSVVGISAAAKQLARLVAMVVLPAPPFGLSTRVVFISARGSASPCPCSCSSCSCVERDLPVDDAARSGELQEKREQIQRGGFRVPLLLDESGSRSMRR